MKKSIFLIFSLIVVALIGIRYYVVNKDVPREYYEEKYTINEWIGMEECELRVNSYDVNIVDSIVDDITVNVSIKNTGDNTLYLDGSKSNIPYLAGFNLSINSEPCCGCFPEGKKEDAEVEVGQTVDVKIRCSIGLMLEEIKDSAEIKFYLPAKCYANETESYFNNNKLYAKYVQLGEWNFE